MKKKATILVVDDEEDLVRLLRYNIAKEGFDVRVAHEGFEAETLFNECRPDVVVLDWMLPDLPGTKLCQRFKHSDHPCRVIMLTARAAQSDRIEGLEAGADDYLTKPFSPRELLLRIRALLDRNTTAYEHDNQPVLSLGQIEIDPNAPRVTVSGHPLDLSPIELRLLYTLALRSGKVRTREQLLNEVWEQAATEILDRTVDAHIKRLRRKLGAASGQLETIRGLGYRLNN